MNGTGVSVGNPIEELQEIEASPTNKDMGISFPKVLNSVFILITNKLPYYMIKVLLIPQYRLTGRWRVES